jgi:integrase
MLSSRRSGGVVNRTLCSDRGSHHQHIDWDAWTITILGKGGKKKLIPLPIDVCDRLLALVLDRDGYMFLLPEKLRRDGGIEPPHRMSYRAFYSAFKRALERANVDDFRIHDLRHTAATHLLRNTGNLKMVQKLLRHSNIKTSAKYAHIFDDELRDALDKMPVQWRPVPSRVPPKAPTSTKTKKNPKAWEAAVLPLNYTAGH